MAENQLAYRRLPGRGFRRQGIVSVTARRSRLWLGEDHLLLVESQYFAEEYRRFYFRDIQSIVLRKTETGKYFNLVWMSLAIPMLAGVIASSGAWRIFWSILAIIFGGFLLLNTLYGPTCACQISTAVQSEELPSLKRLRRARKVMARLRPLIAEAQGQFEPGEANARMAQPPVIHASGFSESPVGDMPKSAPSPPEPT